MTTEVLVAAVLIVTGIAGIVVPVLPGLVLVAAGVAFWAVPRGDALGWSVLGIALAVLVVGSVVKYLVPGRKLRDAGVPGRKLRDAGVPGRSVALGAVLGIVGFFVVPVIGLFLGFVLGIYLAELARLKDRALAWPSTRGALAAVGWSIVIELVTGVLAAGVWIGGLVLA